MIIHIAMVTCLCRDIDDDYMLKEILRKVRDWLMEEQEDVICLGEFDGKICSISYIFFKDVCLSSVCSLGF